MTEPYESFYKRAASSTKPALQRGAKKKALHPRRERSPKQAPN